MTGLMSALGKYKELVLYDLDLRKVLKLSLALCVAVKWLHAGHHERTNLELVLISNISVKLFEDEADSRLDLHLQ